MANIGQDLSTVESRWKRYNDNDELIKYSSFTKESPSAGCYGNSCMYVKPYGTNLSAQMTFNFIGTSLRIIGWAGATRGTSIDVIIDDIAETFDCRTGSGKNILLYEKTNLDNKIHKVILNNVTSDTSSVSPLLITCVDINEEGLLIPELSRDYEFPVKIGNEEDVQAYAESLVGGEEQLLITREGKLYLTNGMGGYKEIAPEQDLSNIYNKAEVNTLIEDNTHLHSNKAVINNLGEAANMLTFKGKVVVNSNEYSFKTLPRKTAPKSRTTYTSTEGGRLPWQV